jgi:hypothetical protein
MTAASAEGAVEAHPLEARGRAALQWAASERGATWAFRAALMLSAGVYWVVGRNQWFIRDDWAFVITRPVIRATLGNAEWLLTAHDGHWMSPPLIIYRAIQNVVGLESYWPYLLVNLALHVGAVVLVRRLCLRWGASGWTATLVCSILLVFGGGWENIVFAVQITYNLTLLCFVAQLLLCDHDGPTDRRDWIGAALGVIGVTSSGFGPFMIVGIAIFLAGRQRWKALLIGVVPQAAAYLWWYLTWQEDLAADTNPGPPSRIPEFAVRGLVATFESLSGVAALGGVALLGTIALALSPSISPRVRWGVLAVWATVLSMFLGIGLHRVGFGVEFGTASRYQYMAAMLLAPVLALAIDRLSTWSVGLQRAARVVLVASVLLNLGTLRVRAAEWAERAADSKRLFELVAGSGLLGEVPATTIVDPFNPDVNAVAVLVLVRDGIITPRPPTTPEEIAEVRRALGLP